jgi:ADP-dependent NAD(P)H-hydrate dehydratase
MNSRPEQITPALLREWSLPEPGESKHSRGHVVVIGGAVSTPGAVLLAGLAALRVGAGVLAMAVPEPIAVPLAISIPESAVIGLPEPMDRPQNDGDRADLDRLLDQASAVLVGPGLSGAEDAKILVEAVVDGLAAEVPVALDAYALGVLPDLAQPAAKLAGRCVLTPNATEAGYLLGADIAEGDDPPVIARRLAERWQAAVSYHGAVAGPGAPDRVVSTGHAGLGTSGSGDVLAGIVAGLLARGVEPVRAACWGTYLHAAAGDRLAARVGRLGFLARELLDEIPLVLTELQG